jgi:NAD(P)-dependent dehydrogenase (short-subunit alcohol dehydrogenase family)
MQNFEGKVAVVTGAASGIGRGMVGRFARAGMKVALADVEKEPLAIAEQELSTAGADVLAVQTDVSKFEDVEALRDRVLDRFGAVHIVCNNAGVSGGGGGPLWETSANDWTWVLGVNLMGVVNGIRAFVPTMVEQDEGGHVVNTSSVLGLSSGNGSIYGVSKHAVTRLTEGLYYDLRAIESKVGASVFCPGMIATRIIESERNRPADLRDELDEQLRTEIAARRGESQANFLENGMSPDEVGDIVFEAIRDDRFYILTHPAIKERVETRMRDILEDRSPSPPVMLGERMMGSRSQ